MPAKEFNGIRVQLADRAFDIGVPGTPLDKESAIVMGSAVEQVLNQNAGNKLSFIRLVLDEQSFALAQFDKVIDEGIAAAGGQAVTRQIGQSMKRKWEQ